ncbi:VOC family protein [Alkalihalobacillus hwajinpoensis]|uniref:VOC family protein n=1 Tax=Guptibacillus hwajinpoensis TaxID=208199 RepID=UPI00188449EE|nr:VOC family protein [Pseudalkalibacillus hwajinpoensis]MBF0708824.1 VOC family protein [Pseudalkalibacillus hwajinpoensis]
MINQIGQIMLYVDNQEEALTFWTEKIGFHLVSKEDNDSPMKWMEIAPTLEGGATSIVLHDRAFIAKMEPELNLGTPSLMFFTEDIDRLYEDFKGKEITVGEIVSMPSGRIFNFADPENHYFAVMERNKA